MGRGREFITWGHLNPEQNITVLNHLLETKDPHVSQVPIIDPQHYRFGGEEIGYKVTEEPDGKGRYLIFDEEGNRFEYRVKSGDVYRELCRESDMTATMWATDWLRERYFKMEEDLNLTDDERGEELYHPVIHTDAQGNQSIRASDQPGWMTTTTHKVEEPNSEKKQQPKTETKQETKSTTPTVAQWLHDVCEWIQDQAEDNPIMAVLGIFMVSAVVVLLFSLVATMCVPDTTVLENVNSQRW